VIWSDRAQAVPEMNIQPHFELAGQLFSRLDVTTRTAAGIGVPTGLILVRSWQGSHNRKEAMILEDLGVATQALPETVLRPVGVNS
jgi:hypothetical protein